MKVKQLKLKQWWRMLLLFVVCLLVGNGVIYASVHFSDKGMMYVDQSPSASKPYIVVDLLYFDATDADGYFNLTADYGGHPGPSVWVDNKYICSPMPELAWNTHQKTASSTTSQNSWWKCDNPEASDEAVHTYFDDETEKNVVIRFYDPYKETGATGRYRVKMYIFLKKWEVGVSHTIKVRGTWQINSGGGSKYEYQTVTTEPFVDDVWTTEPTLKMVDWEKTGITGTLSGSYGNTTVGIYGKSNTKPSGYSNDFEDSGKKTFSKGKINFSTQDDGGPKAKPYNFNYKTGAKVPVQYSSPVDFTKDSWSFENINNGEKMIMYKWFVVNLPGFALPTNVKYDVTDEWSKKVKVRWDADASGGRSTEGSWLIKNEATGNSVTVSKYTTRNGEIEIKDYSTDSILKEDLIKVYFIPKNYTGDPIASLSASKKVSITPSWGFTDFSASENKDNGIDLNWTHDVFKDASASKTYTLTVQRSVDYDEDTKTGTWNDIGSVTVNNKDKADGSFIDNQNQSQNTTYHYRLKVTVMDMEKYSPVKGARIGGSKIKTFAATRGNYSSMVKLQLTLKQAGSEATNFIIQRRPLGSNDEYEWTDIYSTSGTVSSYSYDDVTALPGSFNDYKIIIWSEQRDSTTNEMVRFVDDSQTTDGFCVSTGVVSGHISYGTGTAVEGVKVALKQQTTDGSLSSGMHSLRFSGGHHSGLKYASDKNTMKSLFSRDFSFQMYLNPEKDLMKTENDQYHLIYVKDVLNITLKCNVQAIDDNDTLYSYTLAGTIGDAVISSDSVSIPADEWSHISLVYNSSNRKLTAGLIQSDTILKEVVAQPTADIWGSSDAKDLFFGNKVDSVNHILTDFASDNSFAGFADEFRFFTKELSDKEILRNYNHTMAGDEDGLAIYYPFDEGLGSQTIAYDFSKKNGVGNGRHASMKVSAKSSDLLPSENQLSLMAYTDINGNYTIRGIHFQGEGTAYSVIPIMGIHEFSPSMKSRFISLTSLNHSGVDFEDVSSFPVSGRVFYEHTDYPLEGAYLYVDGTICSKDGEIIATDENGEFTISVPIGDHFITVKKSGHEFVNAGRYPADPNGVGYKRTFNSEIKNLEFVDKTLVNFTGRVVGGDIEGKKNVGFGLSNNNIGVVELVLTPLNEIPRMNVKRVENETTFSYETDSVIYPVASATKNIASKAWRGAGTNDCRKIIIRTDSLSGEFSAMVPPLEYKIADMKVLSSNAIVGNSITVDLSNCQTEYSDTLYNADGSYELYTYNTLLRQTYHSDPVFNVVQVDHEDSITGKNDGAFGIKNYKIKDNLGELAINDIYSVSGNVVSYKYGGAIFEESESYAFDIEAYEEYTNPDGTTPVKDHVPLADLVVTIDNALSDQQPIFVNDFSTDELVAAGYDVDGDNGAAAGQVADLQSNQLRLDSIGKASYVWTAGMPNITAPYTRTISMTYDIDGRTYQWEKSGMEGIILGSLPTGNNFITSGPDVVDMILRDPAGSNSYSEWTSGTITTLSNVVTANFSSSSEGTTTTKLGSDIKTVSGIGVAVLNETKFNNDLVVGITASVEAEGAYSWTRTVENTKTISTSDDPDFVGSAGDVYIGSATNIIFGKARNVDFHRDGSMVKLDLDEILTTGLSFSTAFNYSQHYIETELLPNLEMSRNALLTKNVSPSDTVNYKNTGTEPVYFTTLSADDPKLGSNNNDKDIWGTSATSGISSKGPSYNMYAPEGAEFTEDKIVWYNNQIAQWKKILAMNEEHKVKAFENREKNATNFSFDAGSKINKTVETNESHGGKFMVHGEVGFKVGFNGGAVIDETGVLFEFMNETKIGLKEEFEGSKNEKTVFSYTLAESGTNDALTVDVYDYDDYGPIFRTRGGQTSAPYEGKEVTKYYQPGTTIMEATMQIEVPQIDVDVPIMSDVPTGSAANYTLRLGNASEVNKDVTYMLFVLDGTNPDGAQISVDGQVLTEGRRINVPGGQTISKALQLKQTQTGILIYDGNKVQGNELYGKGIGIVFASESQPEDIADTVFIKARFTPSSSPVSLALSNSIMNTQTGTDLTLTFKDFDRNYNHLKAFRLEYRKQGATGWTQFKEYVLGTPTGNQVKLPETGASVSYTLPMASFSDGEYVFRVVSASTNGSDEVYRYSEELALVKDMQRPTPLGQPEPSDGILNIGDDLSVTFNEEIIKGELTKVANFKVTGVLNGQPIAHWTALSMENTAATASTEADINLAGKDFSFDAWINIPANAGAGTLLSHGNATSKMTVGIDANKKLVLNIAGQSYTSNNAITTGKWAFLTVSYKNTPTGSVLNASLAEDANTIKLFEDQKVVKYNGNGKLSVGVGLTGSIHELLLWDEAHDLTTALGNRSKTKNPSTRHLIGYWKMDEGEGTSIRDYSRNRHMTMSAATWYLNNANKSVVLDGSHYLSIDASSLPVCVDDDYAVEFWMRGAKKSVDQQIMQMGEIGLCVTADGKLQFTGKKVYNDTEALTFTTNAENLTDNAWHHIAVNVLRQGATAVYVDGVRCLTTSSSNVGAINTNNMLIGIHRTTVSAETAVYSYSLPFTGQIDEVRVWNATMNSDMLLKNRKVRLTGSEDGLIAYYPFETQTLDEGNQVVSVGTAKDLTSNLSTQMLTPSGYTADLSYSDEAPAMRQKPTETNVSFTFVASNEKVVINIDEDPAIIEGCTLNFTVRDVRDENGNYSVPAVWSAFVNRKELNWDEDELAVKQQVKGESSVTATIVNKSGAQQMWTLSGMPAWLTASSEYGTTNPLAQSKVTFTVSPATPIGKYQETVYLKSNNGIETPLTINVTVTGQEPTWSVKANDYENSMNVIGRVMVQGVPMDDADDIVAAFIGEECRGVAHPVYSSRYDSYYVTIDIFGDDNDEDEPVTFRAYDASTGTLYPEVQPGNDISFESLTLEGSYADPVVLAALDKIEQSTDLKKGWNWMSLYVKTDDMTPLSLLSKIADDVEIIKSQTAWLMNENGSWDGNLTDSLTNDQMYTVKLKNDRTLRLVGQPVNPDNNPINLRAGWNWVGYYGRQVVSVTDALAGMSPEDGDILKGQSGVAYYDMNEWAGSLLMLEPGVGYMINVTGINPGVIKPFRYPGSTVSHAPARTPARSSSVDNSNASFTFQPVDYRNYSGNAIMSAKIVKDNVPVTKAEIAIFAGDECRAVAVTNDKGVAYLTIPGDDAATLTFQVAWGGDIYQTVETITYETDAVYGTPKDPMVIKLGNATGVDGIDATGETGTVYDLQGRKVEQLPGSSLENGIFIIDGQKRSVIK